MNILFCVTPPQDDAGEEDDDVIPFTEKEQHELQEVRGTGSGPLYMTFLLKK
jgi:hypothetical protein